MLNTPFSPWPSFSAEEADAVRDCLLSNKVNYWTGQECREFEREFAAWCNTKYAIALSNGTLALDLALKVVGIGPGDEVVVTPRTFLASASTVITAGAMPVFADVDPDSGNITADTIARVITPKTRAIIAVHLAGWPCDMDPIMALAEQHGLIVIEDCAQAHGARYKGRPVGGIGHFGAWSFCQDKIMTTGGEGGMLTLNREDWWRAAWSYKDHGKSYAAVYEREHPPGYRWLHDSFGTNWRMLEMQAVIGRIQLRRMPEWTADRTRNAAELSAAMQSCIALRVPQLPQGCDHAWYKFYAYVRPDRLKPAWSRDRIMAEINAKGVPCYSGSCSEIYLEKAFNGHPSKPAQRLPTAQLLGETSLMWLIHPSLTRAEMASTVLAIGEVLGQATQG
jgi:dTDP-4-amino-4,6-dideoxygalactose transaminase